MQQETVISERQSASASQLWTFVHSSASRYWMIIAAFVLLSPSFALLTMRTEYHQNDLRTLALPVLAFLVVIALAAFLQRPGRYRLLEGAKPTTLMLVTLFVGSMVVSLNGADANPYLAQLNYFITLLQMLFGAALWCLFREVPELREKCLAAMACGLGLHVVIAYAFAVAMAGSTDFEWVRFGVGVTNIRHLGYIAVCLTGLAGGLYLAAQNPTDRRIFAGLFFLGTFFVMWSGGRGAFAAFVVQLVALGALAPTERRWTFAAVATAITVAATIAAAIYVPDPRFGPDNIFFRINPMADGEADYLANRGEIWRQTMAMIPDRMWFGYGEGQFIGLVSATEQKLNHPHNLFLQLLFQWGVFGTLAVAAYLGALVLPKIGNILRAERVGLVAAGVAIGLGALSMVDGPFFYSLPLSVFVLCIAALAASPAAGVASAAAPQG